MTDHRIYLVCIQSGKYNESLSPVCWAMTRDEAEGLRGSLEKHERDRIAKTKSDKARKWAEFWEATKYVVISVPDNPFPATGG